MAKLKVDGIQITAVSITHRRACHTVSGSPSQKEFLFEYSSAVKRFNCAFYVDADKGECTSGIVLASCWYPAPFGFWRQLAKALCG
jgi:hypothetical protein